MKMSRQGAKRIACSALALAGVGLAAGATPSEPQRVAKDGVVVRFSARPAVGGVSTLKEGDIAEVRFEITDEATGQPVRGQVPAAWMDLAEIIKARGEGPHVRSCRDKIALYLKGVVGIRPLVDLNSYSMVVLNQEPSLTIIDPNVSMAGSTSTLAQVVLKQPGMDWAQDALRKQLYVSMPKAGQVAVVNTENWAVKANVDAGEKPVRVALQPDGKVLWVGSDASKGDGVVTAIDADTLKPVASIPVGAGHHEIVVSDDNKRVFVSNRDSGTVSVIDARTRQKLRDLKTGAMPISLAWGPQSHALYVSDGKDGTVAVVDQSGESVRKHIQLQPGIGPTRFAPDGRHALVVNPSAKTVFVIDASSDEKVQAIELPGEPFQMQYTRNFAYVRLLDSERVQMIHLETIARGLKPRVQSFGAGSAAPKFGGDLVLADSMSPASTEAAVFVVNPSDNTTYFYMEGMNAPMSNYLARGSKARAVTVVDRSLKEVEPGVYISKVTLPAAGKFDVAFQLDSPKILHCFSADVDKDAKAVAARKPQSIDYLVEQRVVPVGKAVPVRFRLNDIATGKPKSGVKDAQVTYYLAPGRDRTVLPAKEVGEGVYEVTVPVREAGGYYIHANAPSLQLPQKDLPYLTLLAKPDAPQ